ncbi:hypothetical protein FB451DRAFT_646791 [Mycena latifolia]|nr:hypothetical protein FB451DRAFT_646791 [Mycena latifolia]
MAPTPGKKDKRPRKEFTQSEDEQFIEFLAGRPFASRASILTYREIAAEPWGTNHTENSWLQRYNRRKSHYDPLIDTLARKKSKADKHESDAEPVLKKQRLSLRDPLIAALALKKSKAAKRPSESNQSRDSDHDDAEPALKKRRLTMQSAPDDSATFRDFPIPYSRFMRKPNPVSDTDQFISLNLAISHLSEAHGFDPDVVYATWELTGDLHLTDEHLSRAAISVESRQQDEHAIDEEIVGLLTRDVPAYSADDESSPSRSTSPQLNRASPELDSVHDPSRKTSPKRKRSNPLSPEWNSRAPVPTPTQQLRVPGCPSNLEIIPSSIPNERELYPSQPPAMAPARQRDGTVIPETPQPSGQSGRSATLPPVDSLEASPEEDSSGEDSSREDSSGLSEAESESEPPVPAAQTQTQLVLPNTQPEVDAEETESESDSAASLRVRPQVGLPNEQICPAESDSESESKSHASAPQPPTNTQPEVGAEESGSDSDSDASRRPHAGLLDAQVASEDSDSDSEAESHMSAQVQRPANSQLAGEESGSDSGSDASVSQPVRSQTGRLDTQVASEDSDSEESGSESERPRSRAPHSSKGSPHPSLRSSSTRPDSNDTSTQTVINSPAEDSYIPTQPSLFGSYQFGPEPLVTRFVTANKKGARIPKTSKMYHDIRRHVEAGHAVPYKAPEE